MLLNPFRFGPDPLLTSLVAWWRMDETSGTRVNAKTPGTHDLTDNNTVLYSTGKVSNAADFVTANDEYLSLASHADFVIADTAVTIAGWASFTSGSDSGSVIIAKGNANAAGGEWSVNRSGVAESVFGRVRNAADSGSVTTSAVSITYSTFFFFIFEHDPTADLITFEINRGTPVTAAISGGTLSALNAINLGGRTTAVNLTGAVDELGFWRRLLTTGEKDRLYNAGAGMGYPG